MTMDLLKFELKTLNSQILLLPSPKLQVEGMPKFKGPGMSKQKWEVNIIDRANRETTRLSGDLVDFLPNISRMEKT